MLETCDVSRNNRKAEGLNIPRSAGMSTMTASHSSAIFQPQRSGVPAIQRTLGFLVLCRHSWRKRPLVVTSFVLLLENEKISLGEQAQSIYHLIESCVLRRRLFAPMVGECDRSRLLNRTLQ